MHVNVDLSKDEAVHLLQLCVNEVSSQLLSFRLMLIALLVTVAALLSFFTR